MIKSNNNTSSNLQIAMLFNNISFINLQPLVHKWLTQVQWWWCVPCGCSDEVCGQVYKGGSLYTYQVVKTYLRFPAPSSACSWLASVSGWSCVHQKCVSGKVCYLWLSYCYIFPVYLVSCAICVYHIATSPLLHFCVGVGLMGNLTLLNSLLGTVEEVVTLFCLHFSLLCGKILLIWRVAKILHLWSWKIKMVLQ